MLRMLAGLAAALTLALGALPAAAQSMLPITPGQPFEHKHSHLILPAQLLGLPMTRIQQFEDDQLDIAFNYASPDDQEAVTIYVYRLVSGSLPLWFDRARVAIESRSDLYGSAQLSGGGGFALPGQSAASALAITYAVDKPPFRSTGLALAQTGEWLVKVRYSAKTLTADQLTPRVKAVLAALAWPRGVAAAPQAVPVKPCATTLAVKGKSHDVEGQDAGAALGAALGLPGIIQGIVRERAGDAAPPPVVWCRDPAMFAQGGVYRADEETDGYLLALSDAGRAIRVEPDIAGQLFDDRKSKPAWSVQMFQLRRTVFFAPQDRLPPPEQALAIIEKGRYLSAASNWGDEKTIEVNADTFK